VNDDIDSAILARYLQGESGPDERAAVERWMAADPAHAATVEALRAAFDRATDDALWGKIAARMEREKSPVVARIVARPPAPKLWTVDAPVLGGGGRWVGRVAAAVVVAIGAVAVWQSRTAAPAPQQFREFASAPASRVTVTLRDGTQIVMGPSTHLRVPSDFGAHTRAVELDGEASFAVVHHADLPFAVRTAHAELRDIGTTFTVRAYAADRESQVVVSEGQVSLAGGATPEKSVVLGARDLAAIGASGDVRVRHDVDVTRYAAWVDGQLDFEDTPFRQVIAELGRTYDLDVTLADSTLGKELVTAQFTDQSADEVLSVVTRVVGATYRRSGRTVVIRRGATPAHGREAAAGAEVRLTQGRLAK
jgi:transmembrane sensor